MLARFVVPCGRRIRAGSPGNTAVGGNIIRTAVVGWPALGCHLVPEEGSYGDQECDAD